jgi:hypothetical protein
MTDTTWGARAATAVNRLGFARAADVYAALAAASLPWSTTATGILVVAWLVTLVPTLDVAMVRRELLTAAGGAPVILVGLAVLGTLWADVSMGERLGGIDGLLKLLCIPLLLAQFRRSPNAAWVIICFFATSLALLAASWGMVLLPSWPFPSRGFAGVVAKDYISQSGVFALCAFAALGAADEAWLKGRRLLALALISAAAALMANIAYVETGRTTLATIGVLVPAFGFRKFGWKGMVGTVGIAGVIAGVFWATSPYLRYRVTHIIEEVERYQAVNEATSTGARLDFWLHSVESLAKAPVIGHGTGSISEQLRSTISPETGIASIGTVNPHNQIFAVAIQLGLVGTIVLFSMWISHLFLFRGDGLISWIGLVAVIQNMVGSLANSHLSDFTQGWIYVFAIGTLGGAVLRKDASPDKGGIRHPGASSTG